MQNFSYTTLINFTQKFSDYSQNFLTDVRNDELLLLSLVFFLFPQAEFIIFFSGWDQLHKVNQNY